MATKDKKANKADAGELAFVDLDDIVANSGQTRGTGVAPHLLMLGYGVFEKVEGHVDKEPLWSMLLSDKQELRQYAAKLVEDHTGSGQLGHVVRLDDREATGGAFPVARHGMHRVGRDRAQQPGHVVEPECLDRKPAEPRELARADRFHVPHADEHGPCPRGGVKPRYSASR